jgi:excisionase family DNA binding protein
MCTILPKPKNKKMSIQLITTEQLQNVLTNVLQGFADRLKPAATQDDDKMISVKEVAELLSVSTRSVIHYTKEGLLKSYRLGGSVRYKRSEVLQCWKAINHRPGSY